MPYTSRKPLDISPKMATKHAIEKLVTVFGGSGFLGRHVVRALAQRGYRIRVAVRRPGLPVICSRWAGSARSMPCRPICAIPDSVAAALRDADVAINLVGLMLERGGQRFDAIMAQGAETVAKAASAIGAPLVHVSSLSADPQSSLSLCAHQRRGRRAGPRRTERCDHRAAVDHLRAGGRLLQSLRRDVAADAGAAAGRRRPYPHAAGLCRRCRRRHRQGGRRRTEIRRDL